MLGSGFLLAFAVLFYLFGRDRLAFSSAPPPVLRVDYPDKPIRFQDWDPARSRLDFEASMVQALYSPLLEMDRDAQLKSGWAETFRWVDNHTLVLQMRRTHKRANGRLITAQDALISLRRLAFLQQETDSFYVEQFCHTSRLDKITDACPGLHASAATLTIRTRDKVAILPQLLTSVETSLVPESALADDGLTLANHDKGSGPYILQTGPAGQALLIANPLHYNYSEDMPQEIELIPSMHATAASLTDDVKKNRVDHIARFSALSAFEFEKLASAVGADFQVQKTLPMGVGLLLFSEEARTSLPIDVKREWVMRLQKAVTACLREAQQEKVRRPTQMLIPATAVGRLSRDEEIQLEKARGQHVSPPLTKTLRVRFPGYIGEALEPCLKKELHGLPVVLNENGEIPADLRFKTYDLSTYEEVGTIRSLLTGGLLDAANLSVEAWILRYIGESDPARRVALLKDSHRTTIWDDPSVIPLWNYETGAVIRRPWIMDFSPISIANPFHLIRYER